MNDPLPSVDSIDAASDQRRLKVDLADNPAIQRALRRLRESQESDNHVCHYTKHTSHAVKHSSTW